MSIELEGGHFCQEIVLEFKFSNFKKLPFEIGTVKAEGVAMPEDAFQRHLNLTLSKVVNQDSKERIFVLSHRFLNESTI